LRELIVRDAVGQRMQSVSRGRRLRIAHRLPDLRGCDSSQNIFGIGTKAKNLRRFGGGMPRDTGASASAAKNPTFTAVRIDVRRFAGAHGGRKS